MWAQLRDTLTSLCWQEAALEHHDWDVPLGICPPWDICACLIAWPQLNPVSLTRGQSPGPGSVRLGHGHRDPAEAPLSCHTHQTFLSGTHLLSTAPELLGIPQAALLGGFPWFLGA